MTYWAFDEFAADLERTAFELEDASERAKSLLPVAVAEEFWLDLWYAHYYLRVAAWEFRMITEWAKGVSTPTGQPLGWPEIYNQIEMAYNLRSSLDFLLTETISNLVRIEGVEAQVAEITPADITALTSELAALRERVEGLGGLLAKYILRIRDIQVALEEAEVGPWDIWSMLSGLTEGVGKFLGSLAALPAEVVIEAATKILTAVWGEEYIEA